MMTKDTMRRVAITGATGMIGATLTQELIARELEVVAIVRPDSPKQSNLPASDLITVIPCAISGLSGLARGDLPTCDVFYHLAWEGTFGENRNDSYLQNQNIKYALDAVNLAERIGCHAFVGAGSQAEYGRVEGYLKPGLPVSPENGYGIAKYATGKLTALLASQLGLRHNWVRILSVYGPMDNPYTMIMDSIHKLLRGDKPSFTKGEQVWDYLYSRDAARALSLIGGRGKDQAVYCLGSGQAAPLRDYICTMRDAVDPSLPVGLGDIPYGDKQVMHLCADISDLAADTGFSPQTSFRDGIGETIRWVKGGSA